MKIPRPARRKVRIEIIPMIDTMFFLLVFFMVATLSMTVQRGMPVNLPAAVSAKADIPQTLSITIHQAGEIFLDKEPISIGDLASRLRAAKAQTIEPSIVVNADEDARHGRVVEVLDAVKQAGLAKVAIATKPVPGE